MNFKRFCVYLWVALSWLALVVMVLGIQFVGWKAGV